MASLSFLHICMTIWTCMFVPIALFTQSRSILCDDRFFRFLICIYLSVVAEWGSGRIVPGFEIQLRHGCFFLLQWIRLWLVLSYCLSPSPPIMCECQLFVLHCFVLVWLVQDTSCRLCLTEDEQSFFRLPCFVVGVVPLFLNGSDKIAISIFK